MHACTLNQHLCSRAKGQKVSPLFVWVREAQADITAASSLVGVKLLCKRTSDVSLTSFFGAGGGKTGTCYLDVTAGMNVLWRRREGREHRRESTMLDRVNDLILEGKGDRGIWKSKMI